MQRHFQTAAELLEYLLEDERFEPRSVFDVTSRGVNHQIFRGQPSLAHKLLPSAHRSPNRLTDYTPQAVGRVEAEDWASTDKRMRNMLLMMWLHAEVRAVHLFLEQADKLGLRTPLDYAALNAHQPTINAIAENKDGCWKLPFPEPAYLPAIAMAQHYGVPTRLLDWTESPLVAAFFASYWVSSVLHGHHAQDEENIGIYVLNTDFSVRSTLKGRISLVNAPRHGNPNLRAQRGLFVHLPNANQVFYETGDWPSLEQVLAEHGGTRQLDLLTLPASQADNLLRLLRRHEITRHHLMPSLTNAASAFQYERALFPLPGANQQK